MNIVSVMLLFAYFAKSTEELELHFQQPVVSKYFDLRIARSLNIHHRGDLIGEIGKVLMDLSLLHDSCHTLSKEHHKPLKHLCGAIGYTSPHPVTLVWTIQQLHPSAGINLTVVSLNLPFLGLGCLYSNITISSMPGGIFCGRQTNLNIYSESDLTVKLNQGYE